MGEEARIPGTTRKLFKKWIEGRIVADDIDKHATCILDVVADNTHEKQFLTELHEGEGVEFADKPFSPVVPEAEDTAVSTRPTTNCDESSDSDDDDATDGKPEKKLIEKLEKSLAPKPKLRRRWVRVARLDLDGFLNFKPPDKFEKQLSSMSKWSNHHGSFVLELIVDKNITSDELLSTSKVLRAIIELKWSSMGQLEWFRFGLTWLGALSFTAFSAIRQYPEYHDFYSLLCMIVTLCIFQIAFMIALVVWLLRRDGKWHLRLEGVLVILMSIVVWACTAVATTQPLWLLNCLLSLLFYVEVREMWMRNRLFHGKDLWNMVTHAPLGHVFNFLGLCRAAATPMMVFTLLAGIAEPDSVAAVLSILTFLFWIQSVREVRGRRPFGIYIALFQGVIESTLPFLLLVGLGVMALTFAWWVLSMQRPDAHFLMEEDTIHCVETAGGLACGTLPQSHNSMLTRLWAAFTFSYRAALLADYPGDAFALADYAGEGSELDPKIATALPAWVFFFCATYINLIVLLNLLIAIMNSRYEELMKKAYAVSLRQRARVCLEFERTAQEPLVIKRPEVRKLFFSFTHDHLERTRVEKLEHIVDQMASNCAASQQSTKRLNDGEEKVLMENSLDQQALLKDNSGQVEEPQPSAEPLALADVLKALEALSEKVDALAAAARPPPKRLIELGCSCCACRIE